MTTFHLLSTDSNVGAGIDSYYEYCLKAYILLGDETYLERFNKVFVLCILVVNSLFHYLGLHSSAEDKICCGYL